MYSSILLKYCLDNTITNNLCMSRNVITTCANECVRVLFKIVIFNYNFGLKFCSEYK